MGCGCTPTVTEYHRRPGFYRMASETELADQYVDANGRTVKFIEDGPLPSKQIELEEEKRIRDERRQARLERARQAAIARGETPPDSLQPKVFKSREVAQDGTVELKALFPDHVLGNTMTCLRNEEYQLLWDQVIAESTRREYASRGMGYADFEAFFRKNRADIMTTLHRMSFGYYGGTDVLLDKFDDMSVRIRFSPTLAPQFTYREVLVVRELEGMKLLLIR